MRRILSIIFGAFGGGSAFMMQVGRHDAATNFCDWLSIWDDCLQTLPSWFGKWGWLFPISLFCLAGTLLAWPLVTRVFDVCWTRRRSLIPLSEAAAHIYGELRGTDLARFTEGHTGSTEEILDNVGMQILHNADVQVRRQPSPKWELFPKSDLNKMLVCHGATSIRYAGQDRIVFSDPKMSRKDVARVAKRLKENANFVSEWSKAPPKQSDIALRELAPKELLIELDPHAAQIDAYTPVCAIMIQNVGSRELDRCLVDVKEISSHWPDQMPNPLVLRTEGQIRGKRTGRFILSQGQSKSVPILFRAIRPNRPNEWFFFDEHGKQYFITANSIKLVLGVYGATETKTALIFLDVDAGWNPFPSLEMVTNDYKLPQAQQEIAPLDRNMSMTEALEVLNKASEYPGFQDALYQAMFDGKVLAWGRKQLNRLDADELGPYQMIERDYWSNGRLVWITTGPGGTERAERKNELDYTRIRFNAEQIRRIAQDLTNQKLV